MTVPDVLLGLSTLEAAITGIKRAYQFPPQSLERADIPCCVNLPGNASHSKIADGYIVEQRDYSVLVAVGRQSEKRIDELTEKAATLIDPVIIAFEGSIMLGGVADVQEMKLTSDTGVVTLEYQNDADRYVGFELNLQITSKQAITVAI